MPPRDLDLGTQVTVMTKNLKTWDLAGLSVIIIANFSANILIKTRLLFAKKLEALKNQFHDQNKQLLDMPT